MASRKTIDWERVERDFTAGVLSLREIGKRNDCAESAVRKKAGEKGWKRDLGARVAEKVRERLVRQTSALPPPERDPRTEQQIIDEAAATTVEVIRSHRSRITRLWRIATALEATLTDAVENTAELDQLSDEAEAAGLISESQVRRLRRVLAVGDTIANLKDLSVAIKTVVGLEREAFGISTGDGSEAETYEDRIKRLAGPVAAPE